MSGDDIIIVTPERGADELGLKLFETIVGVRRPEGLSIAELLDLMPPDDKVRVQRAGAMVHKTLVSAIEQALGGWPGDWRPITSAPRDGTRVDLWWKGARRADCYFGGPHHDCGEAGQYCDSCPTRDGWCDEFSYLGNDEDDDPAQPSHWMPIPAGPQGAR